MVFPWGNCCCECDDCTCPGETDRVWIVLTGTNNDGRYDGVWNGSGWDIDFGVCQTTLHCNGLSGNALNWSLFEELSCPIGAGCFSPDMPKSPVLITPTEECDACNMGLHLGVMAIHWNCTATPVSMAMFSSEAQRMAVASSPNECIYRGEQIGTKTCETCGQRGKVIPVYQCELLGTPCVWNWWTNDSKKREGTTACVTCKERTLADGTRPWDATDS